MSEHENEGRMDYIEFQATHIEETKTFYQSVFGWKFEDYAPDYTSFADGRMYGGFRKVEQVSAANPLVVIYSRDLYAASKAVGEAGGKIVKDIFSFPGGQRFHFTDPNGNELAVWSDANES